VCDYVKETRRRYRAQDIGSPATILNLRHYSHETMSGGGTIKAALKALDYSDLSLSKWDGVDRLAEMVDFEDFEAVGQLALQIDKGRGKGLSYGPSGDGGYRNTALAKMIDLLKVHVEGFRTNRSVA
jgi:hypothetical protein